MIKKEVFTFDWGSCISLTKKSPTKKSSKSEQKIYFSRRNFSIFFGNIENQFFSGILFFNLSKHFREKIQNKYSLVSGYTFVSPWLPEKKKLECVKCSETYKT